MKEIVYHPAYLLIKKLNDKGRGNNIVIDYVILQNDKLNCSMKEHKQAAINAMEIIAERYKINFNIEESKMLGIPYSVDDFFHVNNMLFSNISNLEIYDWCTGIGWKMQNAYWEHKWSNYFDYGLEWWGVVFWTVYDKMTNMFVVIAASSTD